ncbi:fluoride efflux transporter CrcB [Nocardiopsis alba]|uniref:Fluoride-specific ion channel FluC n=1 Tax=Nocardiopsis alba (strain ATCC BAA-2165 / BE74) TaxID=1205910 RepID=J7L051_NOCAA|nr:fluoride efflux transporter CrcB [Nocardiopsis alba]AFR06141.1 crcB-like family protein [Nocardiopsis alba ATCC BAA-2165]
MTTLMVALGAAVGAPLRFLVDLSLKRRLGEDFPWGTLAVNVAGSLVLGVVIALPLPAEATALLGVGFCGALTTYSTFAYETVQLTRTGARLRALISVLAHLVAGLGAAWCGLHLTTLLLF